MMSIIDKLTKKFDSEHTMKFSELDPFSSTTFWIPTGSPTIDLNLNTLGLPTGIIEMRGPSQSGKTTLALSCLKHSIMNIENSVNVILTTERRDNRAYAQRMGLDVDQVLVHHIKNTEMMFNRIKQTIVNSEQIFRDEKRKDTPKFLFVLDSLGALSSSQETRKMEENAEKDDAKEPSMASTARSFKRGLRWLTGEIYDKEICFIVINHTYDDVNSPIGGKKSYGGKGIEFMPSIRLDLNKAMGVTVKIGEEKVGQLTEVTAFKNDFNGIKSSFKMEIAFGYGIVLSQSDINFGIENKILTKNGVGGASYLNGKLKWSSRKELYDLYKNHNP